MEKDFWNNEYTDIAEGVIFKFRKPNSVEFINLITRDIDIKTASFEASEEFISKCLSYVIWSKDNVTWNPVLNSNGTSRLPEMDDNPAIALDLFYKFKGDVLTQVFTESKTFQNFIKDLEKKEVSTKSASKK